MLNHILKVLAIIFLAELCILYGDDVYSTLFYFDQYYTIEP
jgi:hypothetical protein